MPANLENSAMNTGLEKVNFHYNPKEGQCQRMFKLLLNCTHLSSVQFSSVTQSCPTLCHPMNCSHPMMASLSITNSWSLLRLAIETRTSNHPFAVQCAFSLRFCIFGLNGQLCTVHSGGAVWLSGMSEKVWMAQGNLLLIATTTCAFWDG